MRITQLRITQSLLGVLVCVLIFGAGIVTCSNGSTGDSNSNSNGDGKDSGSSTWPDHLAETKWNRVSGGTPFKDDAYITFYYDDEEGRDRMYIAEVIVGPATISGRNNLQSAVKNGKIQLFMGRVCDSYTITQNGDDLDLTFSGGGKVGSAARFDGSTWRKTAFVHPDDED